MSPQVLILADLYDFAADMVALRLHESGVPFLRLNREQLPTMRLSLDPLGPSLRVALADTSWSIGPDLRSIWYRQPVFLRNSPGQPLDRAAQLERSQWMAFLRALTVFDTVPWMNHPRDTYQAETKPFQLVVAQRVGFAVPSTLVSNNARDVQELFPSDVMIKPLDTVLIREGENSLFAYANAAKTESLDCRTMQQAPLIAQELKTGKVDWRVTVIGHEVYPVRILKNSRGIEGDWRRTPKADLQYEDGELPPIVSSYCRSLLRQLGLWFGGIDLIETADGFFFVEINPTGEFGWLVEPHRPLDQVIARWLAHGGVFGE